jgi:hypothetical protein
MQPEEGEKYMNRRKQKECAEHSQRDRRDQRKKIAGIREKRSQGSDGRIASSDGEKIDRDSVRNP